MKKIETTKSLTLLALGLIFLPLGFVMYITCQNTLSWVVMFSGYIVLLGFGALMLMFNLCQEISINTPSAPDMNEIDQIMKYLGYEKKGEGVYHPIISVFMPAIVKITKTADGIKVKAPRVCIHELRARLINK